MQVALSSNTPTMSSQEIADLVDSRHDKVKQSIERLAERGVIQLPPMGEVKNRLGQSVKVYQIGKRDSYVIVAQLSPEFTARLVDRWQELETNLAPAIPTSFAEALRLAADLSEQKALAEKERDEAIATKALIGSKREATAMATASAAIKKAQRLEVELDNSKQYATVKRMEMLYHGQKFDWRRLKSAGMDIGISAIDVFDANYGTVKAYHADVWIEAYALSIDTSNLLEFFSDD